MSIAVGGGITDPGKLIETLHTQAKKNHGVAARATGMLDGMEGVFQVTKPRGLHKPSLITFTPLDSEGREGKAVTIKGFNEAKPGNVIKKLRHEIRELRGKDLDERMKNASSLKPQEKAQLYVEVAQHRCGAIDEKTAKAEAFAGCIRGFVTELSGVIEEFLSGMNASALAENAMKRMENLSTLCELEYALKQPENQFEGDGGSILDNLKEKIRQASGALSGVLGFITEKVVKPSDEQKAELRESLKQLTSNSGFNEFVQNNLGSYLESEVFQGL
jgi:hypothetical protein